VLDFARYYHVGLIVPDLSEALAEHERLGVRFGKTIVAQRTAQSPSGPFEMDVRAAYAQPPSLIELVQEQPGTLWIAGERGRLHHIAFKAMDLEAESAALTSAGWPKVAWSDLGWVYHETPFGYYVELIGPQLLERQAEMFA
jgi:hypothetical protein